MLKTYPLKNGWRYLCLSMLFVATAMLCKEQGITITGVCAIYEIFVAQKVCGKLPAKVTYLLPPKTSKASITPPWFGQPNILCAAF
ncbi:hypothetical protein ZHAS_00017886 [Anopheles sinensis]|uniref:Uncharacterized protein n=1 Tax=Anopheles sinensis TaxID=74873 RepID=A0A084WI17_ANOSI|nr:hypothetical protein ZHAS_00017886 [Anopheles sinensis]